MQRKKKTSVLLVDTDGKSNKVVQVPTFILRNWKKYLLLSTFLIIFLISVSGILIHQKTSDHYKEKLQAANRVKKLINVAKAQQTFKSIDESVFKINQFLDERGFVKLKMENVGGEHYFEITDINGIADYYEKQIKEIEHIFESVPIGKPCDGEITSNFGYRKNPFSGYGIEYHTGIDIRSRTGTSIKTTAGGIVEFAGYKGSYGNCVIIKHEKNLKTLYAHLSKSEVKRGDSVATGQVIGKVGNTGRSSGSHLHYEIIKDSEKINPQEYIFP